jgi:hypothetical protein
MRAASMLDYGLRHRELGSGVAVDGSSLLLYREPERSTRWMASKDCA